MSVTTLPATVRIRAGYYMFQLEGYRIEVQQVSINEEETQWGWDWAVCDTQAIIVPGDVMLYPSLTTNLEQSFDHCRTMRDAVAKVVEFVGEHLDWLARRQVDSRYLKSENPNIRVVTEAEPVKEPTIPTTSRKAPTDKRGLDFKPFDTHGRFMVCNDGGWSLVDNVDNSVLRFDTRKAATDAAADARAYVRTHGDIDLLNFPYAWDQPLTYASAAEDDDRDRPWYYGSNLPAYTFGAVLYPSIT